MGTLREGLQRVLSFFHKQHRDSELDAEVAEHLELAVEENMRRGLSEEEARRQALVRFGGVAQAKEQQREARGLPWLDVLLQDLRFTVPHPGPRSWFHGHRRHHSGIGYWREHRRLQRRQYAPAAALALTQSAAIGTDTYQGHQRWRIQHDLFRGCHAKSFNGGTAPFNPCPAISPSLGPTISNSRAVASLCR